MIPLLTKNSPTVGEKENPAGKTAPTVGGKENPAGKTAPTVGGKENPAGKTVPTVGGKENPAGKTVPTVGLDKMPKNLLKNNNHLYIERTGPLTWQFACGTILISTVFGLIFFPPFNAFSKRFQNITSKIYNKKACLISLIIGVIIGAIFTFYPPFGRTEPLTLLLAGRTFVIWVVCALVLCPNLFAIFRGKKQE